MYNRDPEHVWRSAQNDECDSHCRTLVLLRLQSRNHRAKRSTQGVRRDGKPGTQTNQQR